MTEEPSPGDTPDEAPDREQAEDRAVGDREGPGAAESAERREPGRRPEGARDSDAPRAAAVESGADASVAGPETPETPRDGEARGRSADPTAIAGEHPDVDEDDAAAPSEDVPADVRTYRKFSKIDGATYDRANEFLRDRTYITAREWAIARLCADFRTETGVEMTKIGENLPHLVPFMTDTYSPQAVNQARASFEEKVTKAGATFLYGAMCDFFTAEELDDLMYEVTEVAKFLLEVEGVELSVDDELEAEDRISSVMREVRESSAALRYDRVECPECGHEIEARADEHGHDDAIEADD